MSKPVKEMMIKEYEHRFGDVGVDIDHARVDAGIGPKAALTQNLEQSRHAASHAVFGPAVVGDIGHLALTMRWRQNCSGHWIFEAPVLDSNHQMDNQRLSVGRWKRRAVGR